MANTAETTNRFDIPIKLGLIAAIVKIVISTIQYQFFLGKFGMSMLFWLVSFIIGIVFIVTIGKQQRKKLGGYISIKDAFQAMFVGILFIVLLSDFYDWIYMKFIDPDMMTVVKESTLNMAEKWGAPQEKLDDMAKQFDENNQLTFGKQLVSYLSHLVLYSIVALICAAIIKKDNNSPTVQM